MNLAKLLSPTKCLVFVLLIAFLVLSGCKLDNYERSDIVFKGNGMNILRWPCGNGQRFTVGTSQNGTEIFDSSGDCGGRLDLIIGPEHKNENIFARLSIAFSNGEEISEDYVFYYGDPVCRKNFVVPGLKGAGVKDIELTLSRYSGTEESGFATLAFEYPQMKKIIAEALENIGEKANMEIFDIRETSLKNHEDDIEGQTARSGVRVDALFSLKENETLLKDVEIGFIVYSEPEHENGNSINRFSASIFHLQPRGDKPLDDSRKSLLEKLRNFLLELKVSPDEERYVLALENELEKGIQSIVDSLEKSRVSASEISKSGFALKGVIGKKALRIQQLPGHSRSGVVEGGMMFIFRSGYADGTLSRLASGRLEMLCPSRHSDAAKSSK